MKQLWASKSDYKIYSCLILFSLLISQLSYSQESTENVFNQILKLNSGDRLSKNQIIKFFDSPSEPYDFVLFDSVVHMSETFIVISTIHKRKNKYRYQSSSFISSFKPNGIMVDRIRVEGGLSDCSFSIYSNLGLFNSENISVHTTKQEFDCNSGTTLSINIEVSEYEIQENGLFKKIRVKNIDPNRVNRRISLYLLNYNELNGLSLDSLAVLRNEIFASHGYKFKNRYWKEYFDKKDWYVPIKNTVSNKDLLLIEQLNLENILKYEKQKL
ncbi:YARHG domain-containing protein [Flagellimonas sp. GZD32]|uniref:YARHG domain-containing protein n=1 Tax=Flagellimonas cixiensis TaxID=3228750 RepID=UPI0035C8B408